MRITVASTFATWPPRSGGALRNFHLYRHVAMRHDVELVSIVKPESGALDSEIAPGLREIRIPVSPAHHRAEETMSARVGWVPVTDLAVARLYRLSPRYLEALHESTARADVVVACHPYLTYAIREGCGKPLVYDAPDIAVDLKRAVLPDDAEGASLLTLVGLAEADCCREASLVLACTAQDRERLMSLYAIDPGRIDLAPNGADIDGIAFVPWKARRREMRATGTRPPTALFFASWHGPNNDAARHVIEFARSLPSIRFVIAGSVGAALSEVDLPPNVRITGEVDEDQRLAVLRDADIALNPMAGGAGSNVKMLDYCAAGLPVITTSFGVRGLGLEDGAHVLVRDLDDFADEINRVLDPSNDAAVSSRVDKARALVSEHANWAGIGAQVAELLHKVGVGHTVVPIHDGEDLVSVLVPMRDAQAYIEECLDSVLTQTHSRLEVLVVDDGCCDRSAEIVARIAARDGRVRPLSHPGGENRGVSRSLELALSHARGRRIALLDADDVFERSKLATQISVMDRYPEAVLCHTAPTVICNGGLEIARDIEAHFALFEHPGPYRLLQRDDALSVCRILNSTAMIDARAMRSVAFSAPQWFQSEDWLLFTLLAARGPFIYLPEKLARYRVHPDSYTSKVLASPLGNLYAQIEFLATLKTRVGDPLLIERVERHLRTMLDVAQLIYADPRPRLHAHDGIDMPPAELCRSVMLDWPTGAPAPDVTKTRRVEIVITNLSEYVLASRPPHPVHLSYHWLAARTNEVVVWDGTRAKLEPALAPGFTHKYFVDVDLPQGAAEYRDLILRVTLVLEGCFWFDQHGPCHRDLVVAETKP